MKHKTRLVLLVFFSLSVLLFDACKEEKEDINKYETQLVSGNNQTILAGDQSNPVVIRLKRAGKDFAVKKYYNLYVTLPDCSGGSYSCSTEQFNGDFRFNTDGTVQFNFDAVSAPGVHTLTFTIEDLDKNILGTQVVNYTVIPKTKGWLQTCYKAMFPIVKCKSNKLITYFNNAGLFQSNDEGKSWTPMQSSNRYLPDALYDHWNNIVYSLDYNIIGFSKDEGVTWNYFSPFTPDQSGDNLPSISKEGKLVLNTNGYVSSYDLTLKTYKQLAPYTGVIEFVETNNGHCYLLDLYGNIYHASSLEGTYTKLPTAFIATKIITDFTTVFAFSNQDVFKSTDNGTTWEKAGTIPDHLNYRYSSYRNFIIYSSPYFIIFDTYAYAAYRTSDFNSYELVSSRVGFPVSQNPFMLFFENGKIVKQASNGFIYVYEP